MNEFEVVSKPLKYHRYQIEKRKPLKKEEAYFAVEEPAIEESPVLPSSKNEEDTSAQKKRFDFFEEEKESLTEKLEEIINADGYYNEILPSDSGEEIVKVKKKKAPPYIYAIAALMFIAAIAMIAVNLRKLVG